MCLWFKSLISLASEIVRTVPSALSNLKDENLELLEPSDGKNCGVKTNLLAQNGFMGKSLSNRVCQGSLMRTNAKGLVPGVERLSSRQPYLFHITSKASFQPLSWKVLQRTNEGLALAHPSLWLEVF